MPPSAPERPAPPPDPVELQRIRSALGRQLRVAIEAARNFADGLEERLPDIERGSADTGAAIAELTEALTRPAQSCIDLGRNMQEAADHLRSLLPTTPKEQADGA